MSAAANAPVVAESRRITRVLIVSGTLLLVFAWRLDKAVSTAYATAWISNGLRLPSSSWQVAYAVSGGLAVVAFVIAALLWRRRACSRLFTGDLGHTSLFISLLAVALAVGAGVARYQAAAGAGKGWLTLVTLFNVLALAGVAALALITGNFVYREGHGLARIVKVVLSRQRMNLFLVFLFAAALLFIGQTSGQAIDSIRSWVPYVFGDGGGWSAHGMARLTLGLAAALLFSLCLYESGVRLNSTPASLDDPNGTRILAWGVGLSVVGAVLVSPWPFDLPFGPGVLLLGIGLILVALLEAPDMRGEQLQSALPSSPAELNAPEWIAITPLLALAGTSVTAAVEAALSSGASASGGSGSNWITTIVPAILLGSLAVLLTLAPGALPRAVQGLRFADVVVWISLVLLISTIVVLVNKPLGAALCGAAWLLVLVWYAHRLFPLRVPAHAPPLSDESELIPPAPGPRVAVLFPFGAWIDRLMQRLGWHLPSPKRLDRSIPFALGPVAIGGGLAAWIGVHWRPIEVGRSLGVFTLTLLALSFALPFLHLIVRETLRLRPPTLLWWFGFTQLPVLTLLLLWWMAVGVTQIHLTETKSLHDIRLVERTPADLASATQTARPLERLFDEWVLAQDDLQEPTNGIRAVEPVPLVLVAAHGGGIRAAYWTAAALDCIVGVSAADTAGQSLAETDPDASDVCDTRRRTVEEQRAAARRIFIASGVSGGAVGLYAYARQLLDNSQLGATGSWVDEGLVGDFAGPAVGWALFHDFPNRLFGLHPDAGAPCGWDIWGVCLRQDRAAVLEQTFDKEWNPSLESDALLRRSYELRFSDDPATRDRAHLLPVLVMNSTLTGGKARAIVSAADLGSWPDADAEDPTRGDTRLPLAGTVEIRDALCATSDIRLSTAAVLAARFPYVTPSGRIGPRCGYGGELRPEDVASSSLCAKDAFAARCEGHFVDGGYTDNSGLFTLVALWPSLRTLINDYNAKAREAKRREIVPLIIELDNHYRASQRASVPSGGSAAETLIPPETAMGGRSAIETYARAAAYRILPQSCTVTISPALHPGLVAPLGWELSTAASNDLHAGLVGPINVHVLRQAQARIAAAPGEKKVTIDEPLSDCLIKNTAPANPSVPAGK